MAHGNENDRRWKTKPDEFAVRVDLPDAPGLLKSSIVVEAGTRALVIDDGQYQGEIPPGEHTMQSFIEKLKFWKRKQATIVLTRLEDQIVEIVVLQVRTAENLLVDITTRLAVKIDDVEDFFNNMMGAYSAISMEQMKGFIEPILNQAIWEAVRNHSIEELKGAAASQAITDGISEQLKLRLLRYGINFVNVQLVTIYHDAYDEQQEKQAGVWLKSRDDEIVSEDKLREIKAGERTKELEILAKNVKLKYYDQSTGVGEKKVEAMVRRVEVRDNLEKMYNSDKMNKVNTQEDLAKLMAEVDKNELLRQEENDVMLAEYDQRKENREDARDHLLKLLGLNRAEEVAALDRAIEHAKKMEELDHLIELAERTSTQRNQAWAAHVKEERQNASDNYAKATEDQDRGYALAKEKLRQDVDLDWEGMLKEQREASLLGDIDLAKKERTSQIELLEEELKDRLAESDRNRKRYEEDQRMELDRLGTESQLDKLERLNELNYAHNEREQRLASEMEILREDRVSQRNIDHINAMKGMTSDELLATAGAENAAILAGVKNNEALKNERQAMNERFIAQEKEKTDAITTALKDAMTTQQTVLNAVVQKDTPAATVAATPPPPTAEAKVWKLSVDGKEYGNYSFTDLQAQVKDGLLTSVTMVWKSGFDGWQQASQIAELSQLFGDSPPPPEAPAPPPPPVA
jgi:hypothetical protein